MSGPTSEGDRAVGPADPAANPSLDEQFGRLWENDRQAQRERIAVISRAVRGDGDARDRAAAGREAHALAGVAAMYGFTKASAIARRLEEAFDAATPLPPDIGILIGDLAAALEEPYRPRG